MKKAARELAGRLGYEIVPRGGLEQRVFARHLCDVFRRLDIRCVLDVGANRGQYRNFLRDHVGFDGQIVSFEPLSRNVALLRQQSRHDSRWIIRGYALGREDTELDINVMKADHLTSFRRPDNTRVPMLREFNVIEYRERVMVRRLDSVMGEVGTKAQRGNTFLKLDTQGFDLEVVRGASASLPDLRGIQTELSIQPIYENAPSCREMLDALTDEHFFITGMFPVVRDERMGVVEFDCVMVNGAPGE